MLNQRTLTYWLNTKFSPFTEGALVKADGTLVPFKFDHSLYATLRNHVDAVGAVSYNARHGAWSVETTCPHTSATLRYSAESAEDGAGWLIAALAHNAEEAAAMAANPALRAAYLIGRMDWYSHMSDDHGVWRRGEREMKDLLAVRALWAEHAPDGFKLPRLLTLPSP